jgi:negative regulator of sigma E activity
MRMNGPLWVATEAAVALAADVVEAAVVVVVVVEVEDEAGDAVDAGALEAIDGAQSADWLF